MAPLFAHIQVNMLFENYVCESLSDNEIVLVFAVEMLDRALKSASQQVAMHSTNGTSASGPGSYLSMDVKMKLGKRDGQPLLTFICLTQVCPDLNSGQLHQIHPD